MAVYSDTVQRNDTLEPNDKLRQVHDTPDADGGGDDHDGHDLGQRELVLQPSKRPLDQLVDFSFLSP
jgi:hypothetical protein